MSPFAQAINQILSLSTIAAQALIVFTFVIFFFLKSKKVGAIFLGFLSKNAVFLSFVVASSATLLSLFYSEVLGFQPCKLCWFQRIFLYPQTFILGIALLKKNKNIFDYIFWLSIVGAAIALYHYLLQIGAAPSLGCSVDGAVPCSQVFAKGFGYVTMPLMSLTAFSLLILFSAVKKVANKSINN